MLKDESHLPLAAALKADPRTAGLHPKTAVRWCGRGVRAPGGAVVRLEHTRVGGRFFTSLTALDRFLARLNTDPAPVPIRTPAERDAACAAAEAYLISQGC